MKTPHFLRFLAALTIFSMPLWAAGPDESNLTLLDMASPAISDLALEANDSATYYGLIERNKIGVFFSEAAMDKILGIDRLNLQLLQPWEGKSAWTKGDFLHSSTGPMFFMNDGRYQPLAVNEVEWYSPSSTLTWRSGSNAVVEQFKSRLNNPLAKVQVYKRFEFPSTLDYIPQGSSGTDSGTDTDRATISSTARKLVIVIHGWNTEPNTDPYAKGNWPALMRNLHKEIQAKSSHAPDWDLYAYRWGKDAYTGNLFGNSDARSYFNPESWYAHSGGNVGLAVENGTQAAEIGYQHGLVLGKLIWESGIPLEKVHFIAHSAGTWVARSASRYLQAKYGASLQQQITLLDPYNPHEAWMEDGQKATVDDSSLDTGKIESGWLGVVHPERAENIYSKDTFVVGTNKEYVGFSNMEVGKSLLGKAPLNNWLATSWDGHSGPINFYAYTVNPSDKSTSSFEDRYARSAYAGVVGWDHSLFMQEYKQWYGDHPVTGVDFDFLVDTGFAVSTPPVILPDGMKGPRSPAPPFIFDWSQILVEVDGNAWVRAMLIPSNGGAAEIAGPARLGADGTFAIELGGGQILSGAFDTSVSPAAVTLAVDGMPYGQTQSAAQGAVTRRGFDVNVNAAGNVVVSAVLADGTAGMSVVKDVAKTGWEASGVGTLDASGALVVSGANGLQVTGQIDGDGGLDSQVAPPQVPEIYIHDAAGGGMTAGVSTRDCGSVAVDGISSVLSLTIRNTGTVNLTDLHFMVEGADSGDFAVSGPGSTSLAPEAEATLSVTFSPSAAGTRNATLRIASNDADENPFVIGLKGSGFLATPLDPGSAGAVATLDAGEENNFRVSVNEPGALIFWTEGNTDTSGIVFSGNGQTLAEDKDSGEQGNFRVSTAATAGDYFIRVKGADAATAGAYTLHSRFIPASAPIQISNLERDGDTVNLGFTNAAGSLYRIQQSQDLQTWFPVDEAIGNGAEMLMPLVGLGSGETGFFRVGLVAAGYDPDVAEGIDMTGTPISPGGQTPWFTQTSMSHDGTDAARSGSIYENQSSDFSMAVTGPVTVSFWWKVSSESGDRLRFLIDGVEQPDAISGEVGWQQVIQTVEFGTHTLTWSYTKDASGSGGADCGWVDEVTFPNRAEIVVEQPAGTRLADGTTIDFGDLPTDSLHLRTFTIRNPGGEPLTDLDISLGGTDPWEYDVTQPAQSTLAPGGSTTFTVTFEPWDTGSLNATLTITSNDIKGNPFNLFLTGNSIEAEEDEFGYNIADGKVSITGYYGFDSDVVIPTEIDGLPVTGISAYAFDRWSDVATIIIPAGITTIGSSAFGSEVLETITVNASNASYSSRGGILYDKNQTTLIRCPVGKAGQLSIPAGVIDIGDFAFDGCNGLTKITIPASVTSIGFGAFNACNDLSDIVVVPQNPTYSSMDGILYDKIRSTLIQCPAGKAGTIAIPAGVTNIADNALAGCGMLTGVSLPGGLIAIGDGAFAGCEDLTAIVIPDSVTSIGGSAFQDCVNLTALTLSDGLSNIAPHTFHSCSSLVEVTIPNGVTSIGEWAFYECGELSSLTIPNSVESIGSYAFGACTGLPSVNIPASVTSMGDGPFAGCTSLPTFTVDPANVDFVSVEGVLFNHSMTDLIQYPAGKGGAYAVPAGVTNIGPNGFGWCESMTSVVIPASVATIGDGAFLKCDKLASAVFLGNPPSVSWWGGIFYQAPPDFKVLYAPDSTGFSTPTWNDYAAEPLSATQEIEITGPAGNLTDGSGIVEFGKLYPGDSRTLTFTILNAGMVDLSGLNLTLQGDDLDRFTVDSVEKTFLATGESTSFTVTFSPTSIGSHGLSLHLFSNDADENPFDIELLGNGMDPNFNVAAAIDADGTSIVHGGQAEWFWQTAVTHDGSDSAQSGDIANGQSSSFSLSASGPGTVSFWWKTSSEEDYDRLRFRIDGVEQGGSISGEVGWQQASFALGDGPHVLKWSYEKDQSDSEGSDCGWVDGVSLPLGNALEEWRLATFGTKANAGDAANFADADHDNLANILEFAFGLSPFEYSGHLMPKWTPVDGNLKCTFAEPSGVLGVTYGAEWSPSMEPGSWQPITDSGTAPQHSFNMPLDTNQKKFVRLKVVVP